LGYTSELSLGSTTPVSYHWGVLHHLLNLSLSGLVFLVYRDETKRALLPNEITCLDTVKALFVRSFPKQLTFEYLNSTSRKIYILDDTTGMYYELENVG
jgi:hypothetical protein